VGELDSAASLADALAKRSPVEENERR